MRMHLLAVALILLFTAACAAQAPALASLRGIIQPLPPRAESTLNALTPAKVFLGKKLFLDARLSKGGQISCNSCHNLFSYGVDNEKTSAGHQGQRGSRNSPTIYNAALHVAQFWDGRAPDVEAQALGPIMNPIEMAMAAPEEVIGRVRAIEEYRDLFKKAFPNESDPVNFANIGKAVGAFERTLLTPAPIDDFLRGNDTALNADQLTGFQTFRDAGCIACHSGIAVGGQMFQKIGLIAPYPTKDTGRYEVTRDEADKYVFKVPSLRNVEKTWPYFHDGTVSSLGEAVRLMGRHQLGKELSNEEIGSIVAFMRGLTGTLPEESNS